MVNKKLLENINLLLSKEELISKEFKKLFNKIYYKK
jgi:hypothetical protein